MSQLEHISEKLGSSTQIGFGMEVGLHDSAMQQVSTPSIQMGVMGSVSSNAVSQQMPVQTMEPMIGTRVLQQSSMSNIQTRHIDPFSYNMASENFLMPSNQFSGIGSVLQDVGPLQSPTNKRKAPMESLSQNPVPQRYTAPKRFAQNEHRPWLQPTPVTNRQPAQVQSMSNSPVSQRPQGPPKKPVLTKTGVQNTTLKKSQTSQMQPSHKVKNESFDSVRSKMRESLSAALALVQDKSLDNRKDSKNIAAGAPEPPSSANDNSISSEPMDSLPEAGNVAEGAASAGDAGLTNTSMNDAGLTNTSTNDVQGQQPGDTVSIEDIPFSENFYVKDELLQGNGLSWVLDSEMEFIDENGIGQKQLDQDVLSVENKQLQNPEILASKIEAELFKLFRGVNKKYKEKGRSLLFNLKDRNNPELREKVMQGDISPERLCSMTAEELASKELSEWRVAKAEELAQMKVLPDSDVDIRKLVRKTHKGEFQVEDDQDRDILSAEVAVGTNSLPRPKSKGKESSSTQGGNTKKAEKVLDKNSSDGQGAAYTLTIPQTEGGDLMQGLMVDDELKDAEFLPPIVSLDEFMESLNTEPPFESLSGDADKANPASEKNDSKADSENKSPVATPKNHAGSAFEKGESDGENANSDAAEKSSNENNERSEVAPAVDVVKGERAWEGLLQLNVSATVSVVGIFKSGEKTQSKDWPSSIEIKGRVRLEAFEKFLQELPMSRSRAVMAVHFVCKEGSSESEKANIVEASESYVTDERVGFGEPASGVELYLCPPHSRTCDLLSKVLPQDQMEALNLIDNGLIGVIVWRKPQIISPSQHKHTKDSSKKHHLSSRRHNHNAKQPLHSRPQPGTAAVVDDDNDDDDGDVPPGFGPAMAGSSRDEDDLPEFKFSGNNPAAAANRPVAFPNSRGSVAGFQSHSPRPVVDHMRELVHRYGQPSVVGSRNEKMGGVPVQPWKDDDDDDMPEWRPEDSQRHVAPPSSLRPQQLPVLRAHIVQQQQQQQVAVPNAMNPTGHLPPPPPPGWPQHQQGGWAVQSVGPHSAAPNVYQQQTNGGSGGQFYGGQWPRDPPKSRGF
ncbi:PHD finger protein 3 [Linum perenne]